MKHLLILFALAAPAAAQDRLSADEFRTLSEGWTLHFDLGGQHFGSEQYLPGGQSRWRYGIDGCVDGVWFEEGEAICFSYSNNPGPQCWFVTRRDGEIYVRTVEDTEGAGELRLSSRDRTPLACPGPDVGV